MDNYDRLARLVDWLAWPTACFILLLLFLFFVVRPFFAYLFNPDRIKALKKVRAAQKKKEEAVAATVDNEDAGEEVQFANPPGLREDLQQMSKMADSNPDRAGALIKQWLKKD